MVEITKNPKKFERNCHLIPLCVYVGSPENLYPGHFSGIWPTLFKLETDTKKVTGPEIDNC